MFVFALMKVKAVILADCLETHTFGQADKHTLLKGPNTNPTGKDLSQKCWFRPVKSLSHLINTIYSYKY